MAYDITFRLPDGWNSISETYCDESGVEISHLEAHLPSEKDKSDDILIDIYVGDMPDGETAEDQAFANYAETVGFDDEDEDYNPIEKFKFNGKSAWGFRALTEENCPMRFIAQEVKSGVLAIIVFWAAGEEMVQPTFELIEKGLRIKNVQ